MPTFTGQHEPEHTWMGFIDGENFTIRAQKVAEANNINLQEGSRYKKDCFVWPPTWDPVSRGEFWGKRRLLPVAVRAYYYTSLIGDDPALKDVIDSLWQLGFSPQIFKKNKPDQKAKGVDIALAKDMLSHAFHADYEVAVLIAGDGDYAPLVEEVKRLGKVVHLRFFAKEGLNEKLRLACHEFHDLTTAFVNSWKK